MLSVKTVLLLPKKKSLALAYIFVNAHDKYVRAAHNNFGPFLCMFRAITSLVLEPFLRLRLAAASSTKEAGIKQEHAREERGSKKPSSVK